METNKKIKMGTMQDLFANGLAKNITFCVTEDCNLMCKYCYMTSKNSFKKLSLETAKKAVDNILLDRENFDEEAIVWEFIGGEPLLEIGLIDEISDYIKLKMFELDHPWFNNYRFNMSSNGVLYDTHEVQRYIRKNQGHLSIGISVDGNKIKHDLQRIKTDGSGSYDDVVKNVPLWQQQFPNNMTKATFAHDDLPYLKDSIISLWDIGIKDVAANIVFEDVWHEGDDIIFENQLKELADYILDNELWNKCTVRFFDPNIGFPLIEDEKKKNFCGAGRMLAIDCDGKFYPCIRFLDFSLENKKGLVIGDIDSGVNQDKVRPFKTLTLEAQSTEECIKCDVASGCAWCSGFNYDLACTDTVYERATFICKMHKANVRGNKYFWDKFTEKTGIESPRETKRKERESRKLQLEKEKEAVKFLQFITSDEVKPHCSYRNWKNTKNVMGADILEKGLKFAANQGFMPVFLGTVHGPENEKVVSQYDVLSIVESEAACAGENIIKIYENEVGESTNTDSESMNCVLLTNKDNIPKLQHNILELSKTNSRINVILEDIEKWDRGDVERYKEQLISLLPLVIDTYKADNPIELNVLTDILYLDSMNNCEAGTNLFALAPNGKIYLCPAFYFNDEESFIGDLEKGIEIKNSYLLELDRAPICKECDAYHCRRCKYQNKKLTNEFNTPSKIQCMVSHAERSVSRKMQLELLKQDIIVSNTILKELTYDDPLEKIEAKK